MLIYHQQAARAVLAVASLLFTFFESTCRAYSDSDSSGSRTVSFNAALSLAFSSSCFEA